MIKITSVFSKYAGPLILIKIIFFIAFAIGLSGCGTSTKITEMKDVKIISDIKFSMLQDSKHANRLRIQLQQKGVRVTPIHATISENLLDSKIKSENDIDFYLKISFELNRPCIAAPSLLGTGTVDVISAIDSQVVMQIQEEGFDEACLGTYALYGDLFDELSNSIIQQIKNGKINSSRKNNNSKIN